MLPFFKKQNSNRSSAHRKVDEQPVVMIPLQEHQQSEHLSLFLLLALELKQNKFNIEQGEYEYSPRYPIIGTQEYCRVKFPDGKTLYEITRETLEPSRYRLTVELPKKPRLLYERGNSFEYAQPLFELTAHGKFAPRSEQRLAELAKSVNPLHSYLLNNLIALQK